MITKKILIPIYDYELTVFVLTKSRDGIEKIVKELKKQYLPKDTINEIESDCKDCYNGGITAKNDDEKKLIVVVYYCKTASDYLKVLMHEKRHCEDDILTHLSIDGEEAPAYLAGYLTKEMFSIIKKLMK